MALQKQVVPVAFRGLNTKVDERHLVPGELVTLENVRFDKPPLIQKRFGVKQLANVGAGTTIAAYRDQLFMGTGLRARGYLSNGNTTDLGAFENVSVSTTSVAKTNYVQRSPDVCVHPSGITVYAFDSDEAPQALRYSIFDTATGQPIRLNALIVSSAIDHVPRIFAIGSNVVILFFDTTKRLRMARFSATDSTFTVTVSDVALDVAAANPYMDAGYSDVGPYIIVSYTRDDGRIAFYRVDASLNLTQSPLGSTVLATPTSIGVVPITGIPQVYLLYAAGTTVYFSILDPIGLTLTTTSAVLDTFTGTCVAITGCTKVFAFTTGARIWYETTGPTLVKFMDVGGGTNGIIRKMGLASKGFTHNGVQHVLLSYDSPLQRTYFLLADTTVVGKLAPGTGDSRTLWPRVRPSVVAHPNGFLVPFLQANRLTSVDGTIYATAGVDGAVFGFNAEPVSVELANNLHITGGLCWMYDGVSVAEHGFHLYPEWGTAPVPSGVGTINGTYNAVMVYEWMDALGQIHQSSPSPAIDIVTTNALTITYTLPCLPITAKTTPISIVVYRKRPTDGVYYRVSSVSLPTINNTTADTVSFAGDTLTDAQLVGRAQLYTNPNNALAEVPNLPAPALNYMVRYRNRMVGIPSENPTYWIYSKSVVPGLPLEWNAQQFYGQVPSDGGPITGAAEMDDKLVLFRRHKIHYVAGEGPSPNGLQNDFGNPQVIPSDTGCVEPKSIVVMQDGIMFKSDKGIQLLGRDLSLQYIGAPVEAYNSHRVTSARVMPNSRRIIFTLDNRVALVYDYLVKQWSVWTNYAAADATIFGNLFTFIRSNGEVVQETPNLYKDVNSPVTVALKTSWLSFAGLSGFQRVWRFIVLGDYRSPHRLYVSVAADGNPSPVQAQYVDSQSTLSPGAVAGMGYAGSENPGDGVFPSYEWMLKLAQQKCSRVQITIQEAQQEPFGEGCTIAGLAFLVGVIPGINRVPAARAL